MNVAIAVILAMFVAGCGGQRDPVRAAQAEIENNIQNSFRAFKDDDHDGQEDT